MNNLIDELKRLTARSPGISDDEKRVISDLLDQITATHNNAVQIAGNQWKYERLWYTREGERLRTENVKLKGELSKLLKSQEGSSTD